MIQTFACICSGILFDCVCAEAELRLKERVEAKTAPVETLSSGDLSKDQEREDQILKNMAQCAEGPGDPEPIQSPGPALDPSKKTSSFSVLLQVRFKSPSSLLQDA